MQQAQHFRFLRDAETRDNLRSWWESLKNNRGDRAMLRRAEKPDDVLLIDSFFRFLNQMPEEWARHEELLSSAIVAAALSHVTVNRDNETFATQLASPKQGGIKPRMSVSRFQQLQKSRDPEEFLRRLLRAIRLAEGSINVTSLAESILHWMYEYRYGADKDPQRRIAVRWATEYYMALPK